jgi:hypothetical protein
MSACPSPSTGKQRLVRQLRRESARKALFDRGGTAVTDRIAERQARYLEHGMRVSSYAGSGVICALNPDGTVDIRLTAGGIAAGIEPRCCSPITA